MRKVRPCKVVGNASWCGSSLSLAGVSHCHLKPCRVTGGSFPSRWKGNERTGISKLHSPKKQQPSQPQAHYKYHNERRSWEIQAGTQAAPFLSTWLKGLGSPRGRKVIHGHWDFLIFGIPCFSITQLSLALSFMLFAGISEASRRVSLKRNHCVPQLDC